jgi:hypothetical protein
MISMKLCSISRRHVGADFEKAGNSVISRIGDPSVPKRTGTSLTADEPQIRKVIS